MVPYGSYSLYLVRMLALQTLLLFTKASHIHVSTTTSTKYYGYMIPKKPITRMVLVSSSTYTN